MSTLGNVPTLLDLAKASNPDGSIAKVVEVLEARNPLLKSMGWVQGNLPTGHRTTVRAGLPAVTWRLLNQGVVPTKSRTMQIEDTCGIMYARSEIDVKLADLNGNSAAWRASQEAPYLSAMQNELESGMFYHSTTTNPEKIMGLAPRFASTTGPYGGSQLVLGGGSGSDNTSIWLIKWGENNVFGIVPKGSVAGMEKADRGVHYVADGSGTVGQTYPAYCTDWTWTAGLCVADPRAVARVCNIDVSDLTYNAATGANLIDLMIQAYYKIWNPSDGKLGFYCNRTVASFLHRQARSAVGSSTLSLMQVGGIELPSLLGIPIYHSDAILSNEATIS